MRKTAYIETYSNGVSALMVRGISVANNLDRDGYTLSDVKYLELTAEKINAAEDVYFPDPVKEILPVDRSQTTLTDGSPVTEDHRNLKPNGQQKGYVVLSAEERAKGFVRPVRSSYLHKKCGSVTTMGLALSETYARDPAFYSGTFCVNCGTHFPVGEFTWSDDGEIVGS